MSKALRIALAILLTVRIAPANADISFPTCPESGLMDGKLLEEFCWDCLFPLRIMGVDTGGGRAPPKASRQTICSCQRGPFRTYGITMGIWEPVFIIEAVRQPNCSPTFDEVLELGSSTTLGTSGHTQDDGGDMVFYNYHVFAFPPIIPLTAFLEDECSPELFPAYFSELDPTWNDSELGLFLTPEIGLVTSLAANMQCQIDGAAATAGFPLDELFWCAGTWGLLYPFSGPQPTLGERTRYTSLSASRALAGLHRRGLAPLTMGDAALCGAVPAPIMPKSQYKFSMAYPLAEPGRGHVMGAAPLSWGTGLSYPGPGEDHIYVVFRWNDCCVDD